MRVLVAEAQRRRARLAAEGLQRRRAVIAVRDDGVLVRVRERGDLGERAASGLELRARRRPTRGREIARDGGRAGRTRGGSRFSVRVVRAAVRARLSETPGRQGGSLFRLLLWGVGRGSMTRRARARANDSSAGPPRAARWCHAMPSPRRGSLASIRWNGGACDGAGRWWRRRRWWWWRRRRWWWWW